MHQESTADCVEVPLKCLDVNSIERYCSPAPYGDLLNESTQVDPSVRRALEAYFRVEKPDDVTKRRRDRWDRDRDGKVKIKSNPTESTLSMLELSPGKMFLPSYPVGTIDSLVPRHDTEV